ncbi:MAG: hypothetical protein ABL904_12980 [Hyphomicrobiaceae bacterium]
MKDKLRITRGEDDAVIEFAARMISDAWLTTGPQIKGMTGKEIVEIFNGLTAAQEKPVRA